MLFERSFRVTEPNPYGCFERVNVRTHSEGVQRRTAIRAE